MGQYRPGDVITNMFDIRNAAGALTNADPGMTATLYVGGVLSGTVVTITNVSTGFYALAYTAPAGASRKELTIRVQGSLGAQGFSKFFEDQCQPVMETSDIQAIVDGVWDEQMSLHVGIGTAGSYQSNVGVVTITQADAEMIAYYTLRADISAAESSALSGLPVVNKNSLSWIAQNMSPEIHWFSELICMARKSGCSACGGSGCHACY